MADFQFDVREVLLQACRCADRLDLLAIEAAGNPPTVVNHRGDQVAPLALTESRQQHIALSRLLASLRLPSGEEGGGDLHRRSAEAPPVAPTASGGRPMRRRDVGARIWGGRLIADYEQRVADRPWA